MKRTGNKEEERYRFTEEEARNWIDQYSKDAHQVVHLLLNEDGTFSLMGHVVCEWCYYCYAQGDIRGDHDAVPVKYVNDPYDENLVDRAERLYHSEFEVEEVNR